MSFAQLGLSEELVRTVSDIGYATPTPIQARAIPLVLAGGDLLAGAQTGTGKTAGFVLPLLQRLAQNATQRPAGNAQTKRWPPKALILTPTRELAAQVDDSVRTYGKRTRLVSTAVYGGVGIGPQISRLRRGVDVLVATPGRLLDLHQQGAADLSAIEILVLDEADRMLDMGFIHDLRRILKLLPAKRQTLLFSATFSEEIKELAAGFLNAPTLVEVGTRNATADIVEQTVHPVDRPRKRELLTHLIKTGNWYQVLVFTRTKHGADKLADQLQRDDIGAQAIHGNKSQGQRSRALADFKGGKVQVLVATDIAARGIDIDQLPQVVNYDLPNVPEDYVHRIGRTGRAGASGRAISLVSADERNYLADIERLIKRKLPRETVSGFELDPQFRDTPPPGADARRGKPSAPRGGKARPAEGFAAHKPRSGYGASAPKGNPFAAKTAAAKPRTTGMHDSTRGVKATHSAPRGARFDGAPGSSRRRATSSKNVSGSW